MRLRTAAIALLILPMSALLALACGEDDGGEEFEETPQASPPQAGVPPEIIGTELAEYTIVPNQTTAPPGEVTFALLNDGDLSHQFWVIRTEMPADSLPLEGDTGQVDVGEEGLNVVQMVDAFASGEGPMVTADLEPGHYVLICNLTGHYERGMRADFVVAEPE